MIVFVSIVGGWILNVDCFLNKYLNGVFKNLESAIGTSISIFGSCFSYFESFLQKIDMIATTVERKLSVDPFVLSDIYILNPKIICLAIYTWVLRFDQNIP